MQVVERYGSAGSEIRATVWVQPEDPMRELEGILKLIADFPDRVWRVERPDYVAQARLGAHVVLVGASLDYQAVVTDLHVPEGRPLPV